MRTHSFTQAQESQEVMHDWSNREYHLLAYHAPKERVVHLRGSQLQLCYVRVALF